MKNITIILLLAVVASCVARDLVIGSSYGAHLAWRTKVNAMAFPFKKRVREVFYWNPEQIPIRGIIARDLDRTTGGVESITAGGTGLPYVNIRLKSARGRGLNYQVEIYI